MTIVTRCLMVKGHYVRRMMDVETFKKHARRTNASKRHNYYVTRTIGAFIYGMDRETFIKYSVDYQ